MEKEIYQGSNPLLGVKSNELKQKLGEVFPDLNEGVCHGMAASWIRCSSQIGGTQTFHQMVDKNWGTFAASQKLADHRKAQMESEIHTILKNREQLQKELQVILKDEQYQKDPGISGFLSNFGVTDKPPSPQEIRQRLLKNTAAMDKITDRINDLVAQSAEMQAGFVLDDKSDFHKFNSVASRVPFKEMRNKLPNYVAGKQGFYMMLLSYDASDHAIAFHVAYRPRLMDANSCEFLCPSMNVFDAFLNDYLEIYARMGYVGGTCGLLRYEIALESQRQPSMVHSLHKAVMAQLTGT